MKIDGMIVQTPCLDCYDMNKGLWSKGSEYPQVCDNDVFRTISVKMVMPMMFILFSVTLILGRMCGNTRACHSTFPSVVTTPL